MSDEIDIGLAGAQGHHYCHHRGGRNSVVWHNLFFPPMMEKKKTNQKGDKSSLPFVVAIIA